VLLVQEAVVLVYDGECDFCCRCANWLKKRADFPMSSGAEEDLRSLGLSPIEAKRSVWWINENERLAGHEAIGRALQGVGGVWALLGRAMTIAPISWIASSVYRRVAANRHRFNK